MSPRPTRRELLSAGGLTASVLLAGCSAIGGRLPPWLGGTPTPDAPDPLTQTVDFQGSYRVILSGSGVPLQPFFRDETGPLRRESENGGVAQAAPQDGGVDMAVTLTENDIYGFAGITIGQWRLSDLQAIRFEASSSVSVSLALGITYDNGTIYEWEPVSETRDKFVGLDGDDVAIAKPMSTADSPISRTDPIFFSPDAGGEQVNDEVFQDKSMADLTDEYGDIPVSVGAGVEVLNAGESNEARLEQLSVVEAS